MRGTGAGFAGVDGLISCAAGCDHPWKLRGEGQKFTPSPPSADGSRGKLEATFLPSEGTSLPTDESEGDLDGLTPSFLPCEASFLRTLLRADALEGKTEGLKGKIQPPFLPVEATLLPNQGSLLLREGATLPGEGPFLPKMETFHPIYRTILLEGALSHPAKGMFLQKEETIR